MSNRRRPKAERRQRQASKNTERLTELDEVLDVHRFDDGWAGMSMPVEFNPDRRWPRQSKWISWCRDRCGASLAMMTNRYGPVHDGDENYQWVLCEGCGVPFQFWGDVMLKTEAGQGLDLRSVVLALGPCTHCGGAGAPMEMHEEIRDGVQALASTPRMLEISREIEVLRDRFAAGEVDVQEIAETLRGKGGVFRRVADAIEARPAATGLIMNLLTILLTIGLHVADKKDDAPTPHEQKVEHIVERILEHYDEVQQREPTGPVPRRPAPPDEPVIPR